MTLFTEIVVRDKAYDIEVEIREDGGHVIAIQTLPERHDVPIESDTAFPTHTAAIKAVREFLEEDIYEAF